MSHRSSDYLHHECRPDELVTDGMAVEEEVLDTILLVIRNAVQFLRLGNILRRYVSVASSSTCLTKYGMSAGTDSSRSGHSLLNPPKPIDLSQARTASLALDLDLDLDDEEAVAERQLAGSANRRTLAGRGRYEPIFHDEQGDEEAENGGEDRRKLDVKNGQGGEGLTEEEGALWDRLG